MGRSRTAKYIPPVVATAAGFLVAGKWSHFASVWSLLSLLAVVIVVLLLQATHLKHGGCLTSRPLVHPATIAGISVLLTVLAAVFLMDRGLRPLSIYLEMRLLEAVGYVVGVGVGMVVGRPFRRSHSEEVAAPRVVPQRLRVLIYALSGVATLAALIFFTSVGVPALSGDVGNSRVALASTGTGYLRVLSHLCIPAAILAWIDGYPLRILGVSGLAILILAGMGNRSVLLYLLVPTGMLMWGRAKTRRRQRLLITVGVVAAVAVVAGGAVWRVMATPEYHKYEEFSSAVRDGDHLAIASAATSQYASVVPANTLLAKSLIDDDVLPIQWGATYLSPLLTALPGEQLTIDLKMKESIDATFSGGGIPPTLAGEAYINFGYPGIPVVAALTSLALASLAIRAPSVVRDNHDSFLVAGYGYAVCYFVLAQVAGLAGASTIPALMSITLFVSYLWSRGR